MRGLFVGISAVLIVVALGVGSVAWWRHHTPKEQIRIYTYATEDEARRAVQAKLATKDEAEVQQAVKIAAEYSDEIGADTERGQQWANLLIDAALQAKDPRALYHVYQIAPAPIQKREEAVLKVADMLLATKNYEDYQRLRSLWINNTSHPDEWFLLDADLLLAEGNRDSAIQRLNSRKLSGDSEKARLVRLTLIQVDRDPQAAWDALNQAYKDSPNDPNIHILRAKLLETFGKTELATAEYVAALQLDPKKPEYKDLLAEFLRRQRQYAEALQTWSQALTGPTTDRIWIKAWFWNRVFHPLNFDWKKAPAPDGDYKPLLNYYLQLPAGVFWDATLAAQDKHVDALMNRDQSTYWLRIIQYLKDGKEDKALDLLRSDPYQRFSWDRDLEIALKRILRFRKTGVLGEETPEISHNPKPHEFFKALDELTSGSMQAQLMRKVPTDVQALMKSDEAFAAAFAAAGWYETALALHKVPIIPENLPTWVPYVITQAYQFNRGELPALDFASKQRPTPEMDLLKGEILMATDSPVAAIEQLDPLSKEDTDVGARASWLIALIHINQGDIEGARKIVTARTHFANSTLGKETLAKISVASGNRDEAHKIYTEIANESVEAKSYLAQEAFLKKDWKTARQLTEELLQKYPNNMILWKNLERVLEQEQTEQGVAPNSATQAQ